MIWEKVVAKTPRTYSIMELSGYVLSKGAHAGTAIKELHRQDPSYLYFIASSSFGEISDVAKQYLDWVDSR